MHHFSSLLPIHSPMPLYIHSAHRGFTILSIFIMYSLCPRSLVEHGPFLGSWNGLWVGICFHTKEWKRRRRREWKEIIQYHLQFLGSWTWIIFSYAFLDDYCYYYVLFNEEQNSRRNCIMHTSTKWEYYRVSIFDLFG